MVDIEDSSFENVSFELDKNRWVVWDNDAGKAADIKKLHPFDAVYLYDKITKKYTQYTIEYIYRKPHMKNGKLIYEEETIEV